MSEKATPWPLASSEGAAPSVPVYPVGLTLTGRQCLVIGGGRVAARKIAGLVAAGAEVHVVAPDVTDEARRLATVVRLREFRPGDCIGYRLVFTATGDEAVDAAVAADAEAAGAWINACDRPALCSVLLPAVLRREPITVAVNTGAASPSLAGWLRDRIAEVVTERHAEVARLLATERAALHADGESTEGIDWRQRITELIDEVEVRVQEEQPA
jgi:precorrin-2 dehydrogenase/sirohydrochlorin ferrochelatase